MHVRKDTRVPTRVCVYTCTHAYTVETDQVGRKEDGGEGKKENERARKRKTRVTFQCQLYNAFYYAGPLLWGNTAMKKEEDVETRGGGRKGQKKKEIALPGFHIESLRSPGTFTPSPHPPVPTSNPRLPTPHTHPSPAADPSLPLPTTAHDVFSDIKLFIVHNGVLRLSSLGMKKEKRKKGEKRRERK